MTTLTAAAALTGCAHTPPKLLPEEDPRRAAPWPPEYKKPDYDCEHCAIVHFATKDGQFLRNEKGEYLIDGYTLPPLQLRNGEKPIPIEVVFAKPVAPSELASYVVLDTTTNQEQAKKIREMVCEVSQKAQELQEKQAIAEQRVAIEKAKIDEINALRNEFWERPKFILRKPRAQAPGFFRRFLFGA